MRLRARRSRSAASRQTKWGRSRWWVRRAARSARGVVCVAPHFGSLQDGPLITGRRGVPGWFKPMTGNSSASDFRVQRYQGQPVLTWWQGYVSGGLGVGTDVIYDTSYRQI